ncbi:MAG: DUF1036 domain-containing protein [Aestuariivirgaceae bacterium]
MSGTATLKILRLMRIALAALAMSVPWTTVAKADFKLCNNTKNRVGVALGYKDQQGWASEGWWNIGANACETLLKGPLIARYYYIFAVDYDEGGSWGGEAIMCTRDKLFTIRGIKDCGNRGYKKTGFFEVDTGEEVDWEVSLSGEKTSQKTTQ